MTAQTKGVDVLSDLRGVVRIAKAASVGMTGNAPRIERAEAAIDAFAELIEAAKELDATYGWVWDRDDGAIFIMPDRVQEFDRRSTRLAAALARCGSHP